MNRRRNVEIHATAGSCEKPHAGGIRQRDGKSHIWHQWTGKDGSDCLRQPNIVRIVRKRTKDLRARIIAAWFGAVNNILRSV